MILQTQPNMGFAAYFVRPTASLFEKSGDV